MEDNVAKRGLGSGDNKICHPSVVVEVVEVMTRVEDRWLRVGGGGV